MTACTISSVNLHWTKLDFSYIHVRLLSKRITPREVFLDKLFDKNVFQPKIEKY